jgi:hypothetical protein
MSSKTYPEWVLYPITCLRGQKWMQVNYKYLEAENVDER